MRADGSIVCRISAFTRPGVLAACTLLTACGSGSGARPQGQPAEDGTGSVGLSLSLPGGEVIDTVTWTITGPNGFAETDSVGVHGSASVAFRVGGLPAGTGYAISISATSVDGAVTCGGGAPFSVIAGQTSEVAVLLPCNRLSLDSGSAAITATTFNCATVGALSAGPSEAAVGSPMALTATATAPDPDALTFTWSAASGTFSASSGASTNFTCSSPGPVDVTLTVSDGPVPAGGACDPGTSTSTITVTCDAAPDAGADPAPDAAADPAPDAGSVADAQADTAAWNLGGNLAVYRVGDGTRALDSTGNPVFIDEFTPDGILVQSIPLPTADDGDTHAVIASGTLPDEGLLSLSADGKFLLATGYDLSPGQAASVVTSTAARVVARIDAFGTVDSSTALADFAQGTIPRSATSPDGVNIWVTGADGVRFATLGSTTSTPLNTAVTNLRQANIFAGQLYVTAGPGSTVRLGAVGNGLPATAGQTITNLPGLSSSNGSPNAFFFADLDGNPGLDTLYVADDTPGLPGGIQKYSLAGDTWVQVGFAGEFTDAWRGLTGVVSGGVVTLYAVRSGGTGGLGGGSLVSVVDATGYNGVFGATPTFLAFAPQQMAYRGVAFAPHF